jgi:transcriptional regulator with XRE-family HTH domain
MSSVIDARKKLGRRIRLLRVASNFSQAELAERIGVSFQQVQKYESGKSELSITRLLGISEALGVAPDEIMGVYPSTVREGEEGARGEGWDRDEDKRIAVALTTDELELLTALRKIKNPALRKSLMDLINNIFIYGRKK